MDSATLERMARDAYRLGKSHGNADRMEGYYNDAPLSGEWAGESIPELLGDLYREVCARAESELDASDVLSDLCDAYEEGYYSVWEMQHETL